MDSLSIRTWHKAVTDGGNKRRPNKQGFACVHVRMCVYVQNYSYQLWFGFTIYTAMQATRIHTYIHVCVHIQICCCSSTSPTQRSNYTMVDFSGSTRHAQESYSNSIVHNGWLPPHASLTSRSHAWATWCRSTSMTQRPSKEFKINSSTRQDIRAIKRAIWARHAVLPLRPDWMWLQQRSLHIWSA